MVSSATAIAFLPGQLATKIPRLLAAAASIVLVPAPARITSERCGDAASAASLTTVERTTRMSAEVSASAAGS